MNQISQLVSKYKKLSEEIFRYSYVLTCNQIQWATPVDTGRLRRSWTPAINRDDTSNSGGNPAQIAGQAQIGDTLSYVNAQPYAIRIEYHGHSAQAPNGMRDIAVAQWPNNVREAIRRAS